MQASVRSAWCRCRAAPARRRRGTRRPGPSPSRIDRRSAT